MYFFSVRVADEPQFDMTLTVQQFIANTHVVSYELSERYIRKSSTSTKLVLFV